MLHALALGGFLFAATVDQVDHLVVPTKIFAVPADSFRRTGEITLHATFAAGDTPPTGALCRDPHFVVRVYDAKLVEVDPPRISPDSQQPREKPVTPYLQQSAAPRDPLSGPNAWTIEKTFAPFELPAKGLARVRRLYVGLFDICGIATPVDIDQTMGTIIYNNALTGRYVGGRFFKLDCARGRPCVYQPE